MKEVFHVAPVLYQDIDNIFTVIGIDQEKGKEIKGRLSTAELRGIADFAYKENKVEQLLSENKQNKVEKLADELSLESSNIKDYKLGKGSKFYELMMHNKGAVAMFIDEAVENKTTGIDSSDVSTI